MRLVLAGLALILVGRQSRSFVTVASIQDLLVPSIDDPEPLAVSDSDTSAVQRRTTTEAGIIGTETETSTETDTAHEENSSDVIADAASRTETTDVSPISSITTTKTATKPSGCHQVMQRMQEWNDCWRRQAMQQKTNDNIPFQCPVSIGNYEYAMEPIGAPFYHLAFYRGQGFGRLVDHTAQACALAFLLKRPCLINMSARDPYFTWRSFVQPSTYNWDPTLLHESNPEAQHYLDQLTQLLPDVGAGLWENINAEEYETAPVFPMQKSFNKTSFREALQYYSGISTKDGHEDDNQNIKRSQQILSSPNWGSAWFTRIPLSTLVESEYQCPFQEFLTAMQNAMYGPTDLARHLHQKRYNAAADSGKWKLDPPDSTASSASNEPSRILPHLTSRALSSEISESSQYGTVHIRLHFLNERRKTPIDKGEIVTMVRRCLQTAAEMMESSTRDRSKTFPKNWWLLADNATMAVDMAGGMDRRQQTQIRKELPNNPLFHDSIPIVNWYHNYTKPTTGSSNQFSSEHSNRLSARGLYGHANMAGSIEDWMALQQSTVAIVVHAGSYGVTGARGNGKIPRAYCGHATAPMTSNAKNLFQIFF